MNENGTHGDDAAPLTAARYELSRQPAAPDARQASHSAGPAAALLLLALAAAGVVYVFLGLDPEPPASLATSSVAPAPALAPAAAEPPAASSATPALLAPQPPAARRAAQEALAGVLPRLQTLRERRMQVWDPATLAAIEARVADGEKAYREQRHADARRHYTAADAALAAAEARVPEVIADLLDAGERALLSADPRAAADAFGQALALDPGNEAATAGRTRAANFERVVALLAEARGYERMGDNARAEAAYRQCLTLDPQASDARQSLARIARARAEAAFTAAMSRGFAALERAEFTAAESQFAQALKLQPRAPAAANALAQTRARATAAGIATALTAAAAAEQREAWSDAAGRYRAALSLDATLTAASEGSARATRRAELDRRLRATLAAPERLADPAEQAAAERLLAEAGAIAKPGPQLQTQRTRLTSMLARATTPLALALRSDGATAVTILKVGALGRFTERTLSLPPGRYTAIGSRAGFRDARLEFTVTAESPPPGLTIRCDEPLPFGR